MKSTDTKNKSVRIYLPSNWEDLGKIQIGNKSLSESSNHQKLLKYLLHCCYTAQYYREDGAPFSYAKAAAICKGDRKPFSQLRKALIDHQIVTCDDVAILNQKSYHYKLGSMMEDITWKLSQHREGFTLPKSTVEMAHPDCELSIDYKLLDYALDHVAAARKWQDDRKDYWRWQLTENWDNDIHGSKTGRLYGTWSRVPRELRGVFLIKGEPTVEVDIKSAHPTLLVNLYDDRCSKECQDFIKVIKAGKYYEVVMKVTGIKDRDLVKKKTMEFLCGKVVSNPEILKFFEKMFPTLLEKIRNKIDQNHRSLAWMLQRQESEIIVRRICKDYPVFSMHDGVICQASLAEEIKKDTEAAILKVCGIQGIVTIENRRAVLESHGNDSLVA